MISLPKIIFTIRSRYDLMSLFSDLKLKSGLVKLCSKKIAKNIPSTREKNIALYYLFLKKKNFFFRSMTYSVELLNDFISVFNGVDISNCCRKILF